MILLSKTVPETSLKPTETSKKVKGFEGKMQTFQVFGKQLQKSQIFGKFILV